jgi:hypothetical protein
MHAGRDAGERYARRSASEWEPDANEEAQLALCSVETVMSPLLRVG